MSFLTRLFGLCKRQHDDPPLPNEGVMKSALTEARQKNREAAEGLNTIADKQVRDTELIRQVIGDMLDRSINNKSHSNRKAAR